MSTDDKIIIDDSLSSKQAGTFKPGRNAWQCIAGLQGDGLFTRQFLPFQTALRTGRRDGTARHESQEASTQEPRFTTDRTSRHCHGLRAAGLWTTACVE